MKPWCAPLAIVITVWLAAPAGGQAPEPRPASTVQQLMQGVFFPNANVIFVAQGDDPASIPRDARPSLSTNPLAGVFGGWQAIENSGLALAEAADLLNVGGRICSNGTPVPLEETDWKAAVNAMRASGLAAAAAARTRSQDRMFDIAEQVTDACSGCHRIYRARANPCASGGAAATVELR